MERFHFESESDPENELNAFITDDGHLRIGVAEERAMDSYNTTFECEVYLPAKDAEKLRDYLLRHFQVPNAGPLQRIVRLLPATDKRVETGPIRFGDDWPGYFIRGDNAAGDAVLIAGVIALGDKDPAKAWELARPLLAGHYAELSTCIVGGLPVLPDPQEAK